MDMRIIIALCCLAGIGYANIVTELEIVQPQGGAKKGDTVVIRCTVKGIEALDILRIVRGIDGVDHEILSNKYLKQQYIDLGRYKLTADSNDMDTMVRMAEITIEDAQGEDGGNIGCKKLPNVKAAFEDLVIAVPVESVDFLYKFGDGEYTAAQDGDVINLDQDSPATIVCRVKVRGSDFEPTVDITVDGEKTTSFTELPAVKTKGESEGLLQMNYTGEWEYKADTHDTDLNGKTLRCSAKMDHFDAMAKELKLHVAYAPVMDCNEKHAHKLGTVDARVVCKAKMNPSPDSIMWTYGKKDNKTELRPGETDGKYTAEHNDLGNDTHEFALLIGEVEDDDFRKYKLEVANSVGQKEHNLRLIEVEDILPTTTTTTTTSTKLPENGGDPASVKGGASHVIFNTLLVIMASLLLSLLHTS